MNKAIQDDKDIKPVIKTEIKVEHDEADDDDMPLTQVSDGHLFSKLF